MKQFVAAIAIMALTACSTSKDTPTPEVPKNTDTTKLEISVYDATQWDKDNPYGKLKEGVTVTLYQSQDDYDLKKIAYETKTNSLGVASFKDIPDSKYYIVAKLDTLSSILAGSTNKGFKLDTLYQTAPDPAKFYFSNYPYAGNFIYADLNGDGKLDDNDKVRLPANDITAVKQKTTATRVLIGVAENGNYKPFANNAAAKEELDNIYNELHTWHQSLVVFDAVYTDDADCSALPAWCGINTFAFTATDTKIGDLWNKAYAIVSRSNRFFGWDLTKSGITAADAQMMQHEANMIRAFIYHKLADQFGQTVIYNTIQIPLNITLTSAANTKSTVKTIYTTDGPKLPRITTSNKFRFTYEAALALQARLAWEKNSYSEILTPCDESLASGIFKTGANNTVGYNDPTSVENLFCDSRVISNPDLKVLFKKGNYLPEIHYSEIMILKAVYAASVDQYPTVVTLLNPIRSRSGKSTFGAPASRAAAMDIIRTTYRDELNIEGLTFSHIVHNDALAGGDLVTPRLVKLPGFKPTNNVLPIPQPFLSLYRNIIQNPGF